jgi:MarC family membrane protein
MSDYTLYTKALIGVLAIVNPLGAIPVFLSLCGDRSREQCRKIAQTCALSIIIILVLATWLGAAILGFFGIGIPAFRVGGGLLILLMAISMLYAKQSHAQHTPDEAKDSQDKENIAVVPLAIPLLAGPGAISLVIVNSHEAASWIGRLILSLGIVAVGAAVWVSLSLAIPIGKKMGLTGLNVATRIMGLLLAAIGIQMLAAGLLKLLPGLA